MLKTIKWQFQLEHKLAEKNTKGKPEQLSLNLKWSGRALDSHLGKKLLTDPCQAIVELIANGFDSYARHITVTLPNASQSFCIEDDGSSMTPDEFQKRWGLMDYDRITEQGPFAEKPPGCEKLPDRPVYGRNGRGRFAAFCFAGNEYFVETHKHGVSHTHRVYRNPDGESPVGLILSTRQGKTAKTGTKIYSDRPFDLGINAEILRAEIGKRFLRDPLLSVSVDGEQVTFDDVPDEVKTAIDIDLDNVGTIRMLAVDAERADRDTRHHGVHWRVKNRLVPTKDTRFIDGRRTAAKRFCFIVFADCLEQFVTPDWTSFKHDSEEVDDAFNKIQDAIDKFLREHSAEERAANLKTLRNHNVDKLKKLTFSEVELWTDFVDKVQEECPTLTFSHLETIASLLAKLEASKSKYNLLKQIQACSIDDLDKLSQILETWTISTAKEVLDELQWRLEVLADLDARMLLDSTDELRDLQPIFDKGLWIFGPEFESIEFTSNKTMGHIFKEIFDNNAIEGSANRPDYLILPDGSLSVLSCAAFDEDGEEIGIDKVVIVELKRPSVKLGEKEKQQCMKYSKELLKKGIIQTTTKVKCFVLGKTIDPLEVEDRVEGNICVKPMTFQIVLNKAKARTHKLYERVKDAPFFKGQEGKQYLSKGLEGTVFEAAMNK